MGDSALLRRLGLVGAERAWLLREIDGAAGLATANGKYTRPLAPFLGVTGVAPAGPGEHSTWMLYDTSRAEDLTLASTCVDLRVTQVANVTWGCTRCCRAACSLKVSPQSGLRGFLQRT